MDRILILHADHEQNASTSTVVPLALRVRTRLPVSQQVLLPVGTCARWC